MTPQTHGKNKYGRILADVFLQDGTNVNNTLVKDGWCWWYRKYAPGDTTLEKLETEAREAKRGLWADPNPVPPWEWRKRSRYNERKIALLYDRFTTADHVEESPAKMPGTPVSKSPPRMPRMTGRFLKEFDLS